MTLTIDSRAAQIRLGVIGLVLLGFLLLGATAVHSSVFVQAEDPQLSDLARSISRRGQILVSDLFLETRGLVQLDLERFDVFTEDAVVLAGEKSIQVPDTAYFRGSILGTPGSRAVVGFKRGGRIEGLITSGDEVWRVSSEVKLSGLGAERLSILEEFSDRPFDCQTGDNLMADPAWSRDGLQGAELEALPSGLYSYSARVAVETDWEFLNKFGGNVTVATDYVADLFAFASTIYEAEVDTSLHVSYLKWWPGGNNGADPWTQSSCSNALNELVGYWSSNRGSVDRTLVHLLSGKSTGCGIAYSPSLCSDNFSYGLSGSLSGNFNPVSPRSSGFWDILVVSHEIGHNFGSPHTHSYCNTNGNPSPVDACVPANYGPACDGNSADLPLGCTGSGDRCGTIMSYCHLINGGYGNIALTFGAGHAFGDEPWRVPSRMNSYVVGKANSYPTCLARIPGPIFEDDFESSDTSDWALEQQ